ncbi:alpha/beta hydrolase [Fulvivirgaceae bacterium BMA10]|uniref:Alpha/beta hydrolase n=1 Tax=Splendidivirga corallicola TaxID=3051826 RepID=A0ABT8KQI7_9BACT|nr:alpha/beta hydrolase [Fulvivirgaceae bacterium BMA10]
MKIKVLEGLFIRYNETDKAKQSIWFLHGFADSGLAYKEVFDSNLVSDYNLYIVDFPGFGVSPLNTNYLSIKEHADLLSEVIKKETENAGKVNIVAHSIGALIGTWICQQLGNQVNCYINIEGNLTEADSYFSSKPLQHETAKEFMDFFEVEVFERAKKEDPFKRYYSSLRFADPTGMRNWGFTSQEHIQNNKCGFEFKDLGCHKIYIWGDVDTPIETQEFIREHNIPNKLYKGVGHWHMIENSKELYNDIGKLIGDVKETV